MIPVRRAMLLWNSKWSDGWKNDQVLIVDKREYLERGAVWRQGKDLGMSIGPASAKTDMEALDLLMADVWVMVVRDGINPLAAHRELLKVDAYRDSYPPDLPGMTPTSDELIVE